jgi:hypothetical protein
MAGCELTMFGGKRITIDNGAMRLEYQPVGATEHAEKSCPLAQLQQAPADVRQ